MEKIACMVCGLDELNEASPSMLGKRDTKKKKIYAELGSDEQVQKREKIDMQISQKTKTAGVLNFPCQAQ